MSTSKEENKICQNSDASFRIHGISLPTRHTQQRIITTQRGDADISGAYEH